MRPDSALPARSLRPGVSVARTLVAPTAPVTLRSPAAAVMTDLTEVRAVTIDPTTTLRQAEQYMAHQRVHMLFVVNDMPSLQGLVTTTDLRGDRVMRAVRERKLHYEDLCVADAMTPLSMLDAIDFDRLKAARVSNVVATLRRHGRNHLLVIEATSGARSERVRGVISRAQVERQLGTVIEASGLARDLAEIEQALS
ncbi:MAG: CBS domain-containing protein [Burkholderiaceae bacterium]|nr:CBS domain-containing protein [Burkholderiaceae bacterium]MEB2349924.1 CBS domain-containing protein [Burkholderiaceae bacterium]